MKFRLMKPKKLISRLHHIRPRGAINEKNSESYANFNNKKRFINAYMDINNICNLDCIMCSRDSKHKVENMTTDEFKVIGQKCFHYLRKLQISCAWEISISKYSSGILRLLPSFEIPETSIYTNGNLMKAEFIDAIFESGLSEVVFSIGESNADTYSKIRRKGKYETVLENIRKIVQIKSQNKLIKPRIGANLTCMKSNIEELPQFVQIASEIGIEFIRGRHLILLQGLNMMKESLTGTVEKTNAIINVAKEIAKNKNIAFNVPELGHKLLTDQSCTKPWDHLYISASGKLSVCPRISQLEVLGNLLKDDFEEIYYTGDAVKQLRKNFIYKNYNEICLICANGLVERKEISQKF